MLEANDKELLRLILSAKMSAEGMVRRIACGKMRDWGGSFL
jgi:hypothetical protein